MTAVLPLSSVRMGRRLTTPFQRGADTLTLTLVAAAPPADVTQADVAPYDFAEHSARFGWPAQPRYVLRTLRDLPANATVAVTYRVAGGATQVVAVTLAAGALAGTSVAVPLPVSTDIALVGLTVPAGGQPVPLQWEVTALLGVTAALLWVVGHERDEVRRQLARVVDQRHLPRAVGPSLDLIGADLGVPRFPPLPYGVDSDTVALYHLDDAAGPAVADVTGQYPGFTGHPGVATDVRFGAPGRYGHAVALMTPGAHIEVASSAEFDVAAQGSATWECFVRPDPTSTDGPVLSRQATPGGTHAGWCFEIGDFGRGVPDNLRLTVSDGTNPPTVLCADVSLPTATFTHVAAVLDGAADTVTLFLDGQPVAVAAPTGVGGAITSTAPLEIGPATGGFRGGIDEVRISAAARADFAPALGERDEHYRRRLEVFGRWSLPTPTNLAAILNDVVGAIGGFDDPLLVDDVDAPIVRGNRIVRVRPVTLAAGETMDGAGRRRAVEADALGTAADDESFDPALLVLLTRPDVDYGDPAPLVHLGVTGPLDSLVTLAAAEPGATEPIEVVSAYAPGAADLRAVGRAVLLANGGVAPGRLAALAHRAGFDFVRLGPGGIVYAAVAAGEYFRLVQVALVPASGPTDLSVGENMILAPEPTPPSGAVLQWSLAPSGPATGTVAPRSLTSAIVVPATPGPLVLRADVTWQHRTYTATRTLRVGLNGLPDGASVAADGTLNAPVSVIPDPDGYFHPAFLVEHDDPRVDYGASADHHRMQPVVAEVLNAMLAELDRRGVAGPLQVTSAYDAGGDTATAQGRALTLRHPTLTPDALAALAFAVGFGLTSHTGADVLVRHPGGQLVTVRGPAAVDTALVLDLDEGASVDITATPAPGDLFTGAVPGPAVGAPPRLGWATGTFDSGAIGLGSTTQPALPLAGTESGTAWVQASYLIGDAPGPYTFQVRLRPELDVPATVLSKDQYDLIMNVLNTLHPIGVEVSTGAIRAHVVEIEGDLMAANPDYTYPKFRTRAGMTPRRKGPSS